MTMSHLASCIFFPEQYEDFYKMAKLKHGELLSHSSYIVYNCLKATNNALRHFTMIFSITHVHDIARLISY